MKLLWFHLMPYTELPDDFRERHNSVWVDIDSGLLDPAVAHRLYNEFMDELEYAASLGFDAICVNEHHANGYGLMPSPNLIAASLARRTSDAAICILGNSLALYNPPTRVAEEMAMIDCISGGRLIAGFPVGTPMDTCFAYGQNPSTLRARYLEAHDLVLEAWTRRKTFAFNGRFNQLRYVYCYLSYFGYKAGRETMMGFWREMERLGKDRNPYRAGFLQFVGVAQTRDEAMKLYKEPAEYFYGRRLHVDSRYVNPPGYNSEATQRARITSQVALASQRAATMSGGARWDEILAKGFVIIGSPDAVAAQLREVATDLNVGHLMLLQQFGNMSRDLATHNTRLFAEQVIPQLRGLFEKEWEDRWWPKPLPKPSRAVPQAPAREAAE